MRRARVLIATTVPLAAAAVLLAGCGNERTPAPDVKTPGPPIGSTPARYPRHGIAFAAPGGWRLGPGTAPLVATVQTGQATIAVWRYPRTEPLPRSTGHLRAARDALVSAAKARDPTFKPIKTAVTRVAGAPAVQVRATETIDGQPRTVRSTHVYKQGAEVVVDAYAPQKDFRRVDAQVFRPLLRSLKISKPREKAS
jgi:hypothetical protein